MGRHGYIALFRNAANVDQKQRSKEITRSCNTALKYYTGDVTG